MANMDVWRMYDRFELSESNWKGFEDAVDFLTEKGRRGNRPVAAGHHYADACLNKRHWEVNDFRTLLVDSQRADGHVSSSIHNLKGKERMTET